MQEQLELVEVPVEAGDDISHGFCFSCYHESDLRQGICGTPMPDDPHIIAPDERGIECVVCFSPNITCSHCGRYFN